MTFAYTSQTREHSRLKYYDLDMYMFTKAGEDRQGQISPTGDDRGVYAKKQRVIASCNAAQKMDQGNIIRCTPK